MMTVTGTGLRAAMGRFATGVAVVTTVTGGQAHGMTVNSLTSVSLDPPVLLVCLADSARSTVAVLAAGRFAVSVLSARQEDVAVRFAARGADHFAGLPLVYGDHAVPVVPEALAHLECSTSHTRHVGDHEVVFGDVVRVCFRDGAPLAFHGGRFGSFADAGEEVAPWFF
jgi:flavin reductase (DIM6/NTAB) family NADH-FMN oxidoreductase RutF